MAQVKEDVATFNGKRWMVTLGADGEQVRKFLAETFPAIEKAELTITPNGDGTRTLAYAVKAGDKG